MILDGHGYTTAFFLWRKGVGGVWRVFREWEGRKGPPAGSLPLPCSQAAAGLGIHNSWRGGGAGEEARKEMSSPV